jgi:two-component system, LytTR family, sensor kinase
MSVSPQPLRTNVPDRTVWIRWSVHLGFWLVYLAVRSAAAAGQPPAEMSDFPYLLNRALVVGSYFALTAVLLIAATYRARRWRGWAANLWLIGGALAVSPLTQWIEFFWPSMLGGVTQPPSAFLTYMFQFGWALPLWGLTQALLGYHFHSMEQARAVSRAETLAYDARLRMLHYQINPHFLFNTLNALSTLVLERRNEQAEAMILRLAGFLRYSLDRQPTELTELAAEIDGQRKYLDIERIRFGDKLRVEIEIEPGLESVRVPSMILQPLLENSIKYAISPRAEGGRIKIAAHRDHEGVRISVEDDGPGLRDHRRTGVGLANARERLHLIFGDRASLDVGNIAPRGCKAEIWLPLEKSDVGRTHALAVGGR